ncbi:restriction endonuclease [Cellulomonas sp. HZM]|uniref:restriction endonuclease n=1 Tax=Cellulomonas sp. HZM TaxID=1454010 RepID=UPI0009DCD38B|nr:restriction endonuclease [Cellulomonas sp. HZM]
MSDQFAGSGWQWAEQRAVQHLRSLGFSDARRGVAGADGGVDAVGTGVVAQVKDWARPVGEPPVRDLHGTALAAGARGVFYSSAGYTRQAQEWATRNGVALFVLGFDGAEPVTQAAHAMVRRGAGVGRRVGIFAQQRIASVDKRVPSVRREIDTLVQRATVQAATGSTRKRRRAEGALKMLAEYRRQLTRIESLDPSTRGLDKALRDLHGYVRKVRSQL